MQIFCQTVDMHLCSFILNKYQLLRGVHLAAVVCVYFSKGDKKDSSGLYQWSSNWGSLQWGGGSTSDANGTFCSTRDTAKHLAYNPQGFLCIWGIPPQQAIFCSISSGSEGAVHTREGSEGCWIGPLAWSLAMLGLYIRQMHPFSLY